MVMVDVPVCPALGISVAVQAPVDPPKVMSLAPIKDGVVLDVTENEPGESVLSISTAARGIVAWVSRNIVTSEIAPRVGG